MGVCIRDERGELWTGTYQDSTLAIADCWQAASDLDGRSVEELKAAGFTVAKVMLVECEQ